MLFAVACQNGEQAAARGILDEEDLKRDTVKDENENATVKIEGEHLKARFEKMAAYAGATDYFFRTEAGKQVKVSVIDLAGEVDVQVPDFLTETKDGELVTNTEYVGKEFALVLKGSEVKEVRLLK